MTDSDKILYSWSGQEVEVQWDRRLCIHIGECTRAKGEIFKSGRANWAEPDRRPADEVQAVAVRCPTGALTYEKKDGGNTETAANKNTVVVANCGPLYVRGDLEIAGAAENMAGVKFRAALCRCGQSKVKPFCDNSHEGAGFKDYGAVGQTGEADIEAVYFTALVIQ